MSGYYEKVLYPYVMSLIRNNKKVTPEGYSLYVKELSDLDKHEFAMHLLEYDDRDLHSIYENDKYEDLVAGLLRLLGKGSKDNKIEFAESVADNVVAYYEKNMQQIIDDLLSEVQQEDIYRSRFGDEDDHSYGQVFV